MCSRDRHRCLFLQVCLCDRASYPSPGPGHNRDLSIKLSHLGFSFFVSPIQTISTFQPSSLPQMTYYFVLILLLNCLNSTLSRNPRVSLPPFLYLAPARFQQRVSGQFLYPGAPAYAGFPVIVPLLSDGEPPEAHVSHLQLMFPVVLSLRSAAFRL